MHISLTGHIEVSGEFMEIALRELFTNYPIRAAIIAWTIAQGIKVLLNVFEKGSFDATRIYGAGGMPSSHTAFVIALCINIGKRFGFNTAVFAVALGFAAVVMYDAVGIRRAAGKQAAAINRLFSHSGLTLEKQLKELLGHTPLQVAAGAILGIVIGAIF